MSRISINIGTHGIETTASEMRKRLAKVLSRIPGDTPVTFNLSVHLERFAPGVDSAVYGELAAPENN